eukprot:scaffold47053_cov77-Phaeocystis_antarctica.AAC.3
MPRASCAPLTAVRTTRTLAAPTVSLHRAPPASHIAAPFPCACAGLTYESHPPPVIVEPEEAEPRGQAARPLPPAPPGRRSAAPAIRLAPSRSVFPHGETETPRVQYFHVVP